MRLLSTSLEPSGALKAQEFYDQDRPPYAILSHTWDEDEVLFADLKISELEFRAGYWKIKLTLEQAQKGGLQWVWVDTVCINKESSAELSEAINASKRWDVQPVPGPSDRGARSSRGINEPKYAMSARLMLVSSTKSVLGRTTFTAVAGSLAIGHSRNYSHRGPSLSLLISGIISATNQSFRSLFPLLLALRTNFWRGCALQSQQA